MYILLLRLENTDTDTHVYTHAHTPGKAGDHTQSIPSWTGFNSYIAEAGLPLATIRYLPFIRAPPTAISTIYTVLLKFVQLADALGQPHILVTANMVIYFKAQEIMWDQPPKLAGKVTMRVGGMHLTMAFLASIGSL